MGQLLCEQSWGLGVLGLLSFPLPAPLTSGIPGRDGENNSLWEQGPAAGAVTSLSLRVPWGQTTAWGQQNLSGAVTSLSRAAPGDCALLGALGTNHGLGTAKVSQELPLPWPSPVLKGHQQGWQDQNLVFIMPGIQGCLYLIPLVDVEVGDGSAPLFHVVPQIPHLEEGLCHCFLCIHLPRNNKSPEISPSFPLQGRKFQHILIQSYPAASALASSPCFSSRSCSAQGCWAEVEQCPGTARFLQVTNSLSSSGPSRDWSSSGLGQAAPAPAGLGQRVPFCSRNRGGKPGALFCCHPGASPACPALLTHPEPRPREPQAQSSDLGFVLRNPERLKLSGIRCLRLRGSEGAEISWQNLKSRCPPLLGAPADEGTKPRWRLWTAGFGTGARS